MSLIGTGFLSKYAPVIFLSTAKGRMPPGVEKLMHTLIVAAIVAIVTSAVTVYGTVRVIQAEMSYQGKDIARIANLAEEAVRVQREIVPMRNLQIQQLQEKDKDHDMRLERLEKRR